MSVLPPSLSLTICLLLLQCASASIILRVRELVLKLSYSLLGAINVCLVLFTVNLLLTNLSGADK